MIILSLKFAVLENFLLHFFLKSFPFRITFSKNPEVKYAFLVNSFTRCKDNKKSFSYMMRGLKTISTLHILTFAIGENVRAIITTILIWKFTETNAIVCITTTYKLVSTKSLLVLFPFCHARGVYNEPPEPWSTPSAAPAEPARLYRQAQARLAE